MLDVVGDVCSPAPKGFLEHFTGLGGSPSLAQRTSCIGYGALDPLNRGRRRREETTKRPAERCLSPFFASRRLSRGNSGVAEHLGNKTGGESNSRGRLRHSLGKLLDGTFCFRNPKAGQALVAKMRGGYITGLKRVIVWGESMGTLPALALAESTPGISAAYSACTVPPTTQQAFAQAKPAAAGKALPKLPLDNPQAKALAYAETTKGITHKAFKPGSDCANCMLYKGAAGQAYGPCTLFPQHSVAAKGWCSAWAKKV